MLGGDGDSLRLGLRRRLSLTLLELTSNGGGTVLDFVALALAFVPLDDFDHDDCFWRLGLLLAMLHSLSPGIGIFSRGGNKRVVFT